ncbi:amidohydrolase [Pseudofrankia inefficax]|uniref:Amidohydrolase n=1 Tax=Pseudofrankia inefficax (strain DSM 45817 / CECT 9037 / DDB 130130 / EuI1c) TaxID=298654 RepID=E3J5Z3_PSEI1|nr:amidohydrolase [Pseudofrankia inefficax]
MAQPTNSDGGPRFALRGRIVTMDAADTVLPDGAIYVSGGVIDAVTPADAPPPAGHEAIVPVATGGTVYPGLIELHNHLPYDVLRLWDVPRRYTNRDQWAGTADYHRLVTGPMTVLGSDPTLMPAVVRYVETKALVNGTTTSQGIALFSNTGARHMYRGVVRNVEQTDDPTLPAALSRIADVEATDAAKFLARLRGNHRLLLHLAEGIDTAARNHFLALQLEDGQWAITDNLVGIHCTGLHPEDFQVLAAHGGSMVWSPLSNLLLYGQTSDIAAAKAAGVRIGLGADWSVSGSKGLLGELKAARLASTAAGGVFTDRDLVAMATRDAATILQWNGKLGTLETGRYADLLVIDTTTADPYTALIDARDHDIILVTIAGIPRYGTTTLMHTLTADDDQPAPEDPHLDGPGKRLLYLRQDTADPTVEALSLTEATGRLTTALADLPNHVAQPSAAATFAAAGGRPRWRLALDEIEPTGLALRPHLPLRTGAARPRETTPNESPPGPFTHAAPAQHPVALDQLTSQDDEEFRQILGAEHNLPDGFGKSLTDLLT